MEQLVLKATKRTETGKAAAKRLRETGNLPAVMYNHQGQATMISVNEAEFTKVWKQATKTTIICLDVEGTKYQAFIKDNSGIPLPFSHFEIALSVTPNFSASSFCSSFVSLKPCKLPLDKACICFHN